MADRAASSTTVDEPVGPPPSVAGLVPALVIAWSGDEPERIGEVVLVPPEGGAIGRADDSLPFVRQRPGSTVVRGPLASPRLSRRHLEVSPAAGGAVHVESVGRAPTVWRGRVVQRATVPVGEVLAVGASLLLLVTERPAVLPVAPGGAAPSDFPFGGADAAGMVGESPAAWVLRERVTFSAPRPLHALITGPSGTGKELVARAIHAGSPRAGRALVSRNAATIPEGLIDAELFGTVRNYPNAGMPERPGLVGEASGSTLFLDEIGELDPALQAHLLRLCDGGEYQRLGDPRPRRADVRVVAATNRAPEELKFDFLARFRLRLAVPGLDARREDTLLLARHLLAGIAAEDPGIAARFGPHPAVSQRLALALLGRAWTTHVRELETLLWLALADSPGPVLDAELPVPRAPVDPSTLGREEIQAAIERAGGQQELAWRALGLSSRFVLRRLLEKHGLR